MLSLSGRPHLAVLERRHLRQGHPRRRHRSGRGGGERGGRSAQFSDSARSRCERVAARRQARCAVPHGSGCRGATERSAAPPGILTWEEPCGGGCASERCTRDALAMCDAARAGALCAHAPAGRSKGPGDSAATVLLAIVLLSASPPSHYLVPPGCRSRARARPCRRRGSRRSTQMSHCARARMALRCVCMQPT